MKKLTLDEVIDRLTLFDDALMSMVFDGNNRAAELFLRIVLEREDITVNRVVGQRKPENPLVEGRGIRLDIWAEDSTGRQFDIEVQRETGGAHFRRARFRACLIVGVSTIIKQALKAVCQMCGCWKRGRGFRTCGTPM